VAVQSLAVLSATLADATAQAWLRIVGLGLCAEGIVLYVRTLVRFDLRELLRGRGDQWVAGGALAISAFAYAKLHSHLLPLRVASIALWTAAAAWLPALVAGELLRPRLSGAPERWSTVFPLGMYAAMSFAVTALAGMHWMRVFARSWTWVAAAVWALVLIDAVARGRSA
jgi:hypothetical protein